VTASPIGRNARASGRFGWLMAAMLAAVVFGPARAQPPSAPVFASPNLTSKGVQALAVNCTPCHGPGGRPVEGSRVAGLAGRPAEQIIGMMKAFKEGKGNATVMPQIARAYSDAEIVALAAYFAQQP
jgi:sulfide dehydrogenase cytochrome subunit